MWPIVKISYREMLSKRIFSITLLMSLAFLLLYAVAVYFAAGQMSDMLGRRSTADLIMEQGFISTQLLGVGLYFGSFITALLAILSSVGSIAQEIDSHQIDTWLARPLPRRTYLVGKFIGLGSLLVVYAAAMFAGIILTNQLVGGEVLAVDVTAGQILKAAGLFVLQPVILVSVALFLSCTASTVTGGIVLIILYGIGFIGGFIEQLGALMEKAELVNIGIISSLVFPIDALFRKMTILLFDQPDNPLSLAAQGLFGSLSAPSDAMLVYTVLYGAVALWLAVRTFVARDV
ncbi:ABC transporter permease subunit [Brevibacillus sp. H7]|uniref:ABC transporter permease subunit n=1 Tax=Brevibacillus sp. H7 TaxID=3349138 RepID=UPI003823CCB7